MSSIKMKVKITPITPTEEGTNPCIQTILSSQSKCENYFNHELSGAGEPDFSKDIAAAMDSFVCTLNGLRVTISIYIDNEMDAGFKWDMKDPDSLQRLTERLIDYLSDL